MELNDFEKNYVFTTRIDLDDDGGEFIELREPTDSEMRGLMGKDGPEQMKHFADIFPACIIGHSFTVADDKPAKNKAVGDMLVKSSSRFYDILTTWVESLPMSQKKSTN